MLQAFRYVDAIYKPVEAVYKIEDPYSNLSWCNTITKHELVDVKLNKILNSSAATISSSCKSDPCNTVDIYNSS